MVLVREEGVGCARSSLALRHGTDIPEIRNPTAQPTHSKQPLTPSQSIDPRLGGKDQGREMQMQWQRGIFTRHDAQGVGANRSSHVQMVFLSAARLHSS
jgi:hypothetical protein